MFSKFNRDTFSMKLFKIFASSVVVIAVIITAIFIFTQNRTTEDSLVKEGKMLAHILSRTARAGIFSENRELLEESVQGISDERQITGIWLFSDKGRELFAWNGASARPSGGKDSGLLLSPEGKLMDVARVGNTIVFQTPSYMESYGNAMDLFYSEAGFEEPRENRLIGYVKIQMDTAHLQTALINTLLRDVLALTIFLLAGFIFIYVTAEKASRPLVKLTETVRSFGRGKPFEKVPVESNDEIGRLANAFNEMADNLRKKEEDALVYEERLRYAKKMEAVGTLAKGISHDFKNILTTIEGAMYVIDRHQPHNDETIAMSGKIHSAIDKSRELIQGLVAFSRTQRINLNRLDMVSLIGNSESMLGNILGRQIALKIHLPEQPLVIMADRIQIERVFMNLCSNAADAMPEGGVLTITAVEREIPQFLKDKPVAREGVQKPQGTESARRYAEITVEDTGTGIDNEIVGKIFEPFFTTKESGKGTGLGLSIVFGIIEQHEGHIEVESEAGKGSVFRIFLPLIGDSTVIH